MTAFTAHNQPGAGGEFLPWVGNLVKASADHYGVFGAQLTDRIKNAADGDIADGQAVFSNGVGMPVRQSVLSGTGVSAA